MCIGDIVIASQCHRHHRCRLSSLWHRVIAVVCGGGGGSRAAGFTDFTDVINKVTHNLFDGRIMLLTFTLATLTRTTTWAVVTYLRKTPSDEVLV